MAHYERSLQRGELHAVRRAALRRVEAAAARMPRQLSLAEQEQVAQEMARIAEFEARLARVRRERQQQQQQQQQQGEQ